VFGSVSISRILFPAKGGMMQFI